MKIRTAISSKEKVEARERGRPIIREEDLERIRDKDRRICGMLLELKHIVLCSARKEAESHVDYDL